MKGDVNRHAQSICPGFAHDLVRTVGAVSMLAVLCISAPEPLTLAIGGGAVLSALSTPANARCLLNGAYRDDIASGGDCLEAQRTGCVRHMLTEQQYSNCLAAQRTAHVCIVNGQVRNEFTAEDCREAQATGCVRRLLTPAQYVNCLNAQKH